MTLKSVLNLCCDLSGEKCSHVTIIASLQFFVCFLIRPVSVLKKQQISVILLNVSNQSC